ncbi:MAG: hypothetical protein ACTSQP_11065 [Promethearchaeota archaeon]
MPTLPHLILGGIFGVCLYYISDRKFTKMHVFILFINNLLGPDLGWVLGVGNISHSIIGTIFYALFLTFIYHYITKFTIKIDGIKDIEIIELEKHRLSYSQTYYLVLAGCIMHNYLDDIINNGGVFIITPNIGDYKGFRLTINDLIEFSKEGIINVDLIISFSIAMILYFGFIISFVYFLKKNTFKEAIYLIIHICAFFTVFYLFGNYKTTFHSDNGAIIYLTIFWLIPIILCTLSVKRPILIANSRSSKSKLSIKLNKIKLYQTFLLLLAIITLIEGIVLMILRNSIVGILINSEITTQKYQNDILSGILIVSISLIIVGGIEFSCWFFLFRKTYENKNKNIIWTSFWLFFLGGAILAISLFSLAIQDVIFNYLNTKYSVEAHSYFSIEELMNIIIFMGIVLLILALIELNIATILLLESKYSWKFAIYFHLILSWTIAGLLIACYLSENNVKEFISKKKN